MAKHPGGRPLKYNDTMPDLAYKFCLLGATDEDLARNFEVEVSTINKWKLDFPKFSDAIKAGKDEADANVADRLYKRATGYEHKAVKIFADPKTGAEKIVEYVERYPPDATSMIFWLKNRQRDRWRDKTEQDVRIKEMPKPILGGASNVSSDDSDPQAPQAE